MTNIQEYLGEHKEEFKRWIADNEQGRIDIKILPFLQDIENGFFVEAGALDGLFMSNTKVLEDLGWNGLLIEPSLKAAKRCLENRKAIVERCCLVSKEYDKPTIVGDFAFDGEHGIGAWSSVTRRAYGHQVGGKFTPFGAEVIAVTLENLFRKHNIGRVDFFSLDVEGYELEVLKGINFAEIDITYFLIEINNLEYTLEDIEKVLIGYKNLGCLSNFTTDNSPDWDGSHNDYLFTK